KDINKLVIEEFNYTNQILKGWAANSSYTPVIFKKNYPFYIISFIVMLSIIVGILDGMQPLLASIK
ncbi:hypothetical protein NEQG_01449, partial [Nematocida parisii ERTm3]